MVITELIIMIFLVAHIEDYDKVIFAMHPLIDINSLFDRFYFQPTEGGLVIFTVMEGSFLAGLTGAGELQVNSFHHQAVDTVAPGFVVDALSEDGLVEAIHLPEKRFVLGLQWHPEFFLDQEWAQGIFKGFVEKCGK